MLNVFTLRKLFRLVQTNIEIVHTMYLYVCTFVYCASTTKNNNNKTISITQSIISCACILLRCNYIGYSEYGHNKVYNAIHSVFVGPDDTNVLHICIAYCIIFLLLFCSLNFNRLILMYEMFCLRFSRRWRMARHETFSFLL